jgi:Protein of unknown function (DUF3618)
VTDKATGSSDSKPKPRSTADIQADIDETRERLVQNLNQLKAETAPKALLEKARNAARGVFLDPTTGAVRVERVAAVAGGVVAIIIVRRGIKSRGRRRELERLSQVVWVPVPKSTMSEEFAGVARSAAELAPAAITS